MGERVLRAVLVVLRRDHRGGIRLVAVALEILRLDGIEHAGETAFVEHLSLAIARLQQHVRSEEHTSELQSLMRISYAVFCLKKKKQTYQTINHYNKHNTAHTKANSMQDLTT